jgi:hypothetical protein
MAEQETNGGAFDPGLQDAKDQGVRMRGYIFFVQDGVVAGTRHLQSTANRI